MFGDQVRVLGLDATGELSDWVVSGEGAEFLRGCEGTGSSILSFGPARS